TEHQLVLDNVISLIFADRLYEGGDPRALFLDWHSSDRPPLQTGIILAQQPLMALSTLSLGLHYELLSVAFQCSWVPAIWTLCRLAKMSKERLALVLFFLVFSGFALINC